MNRHAKIFVDTINAAAKQSSRVKLFDDFLKISAAALRRDEKTFAEVDNKELHCDLLGMLMGALDFDISEKVLHDHGLGITYRIPTDSSHKPRYHDELGEIFHALELNDRGGGQVFTPRHVADIMGETAITAELVERQLAEKGYVSIIENCCGSGALILGSLNALLKLGVNPNHYALIHAGDTDPRCVLMTFIQLSLYQIPAVVSCRDAITDEVYGEPFITPILQKRLKVTP